MKLRIRWRSLPAPAQYWRGNCQAVCGRRRQGRRGRNRQAARRTCRGRYQGGGRRSRLFIADVSRGSEVAALVQAVVARFGRIDVLVNNVAISDNKHIFGAPADRMRAGGHVESQFLMGKHVGRQMAAQSSGGRIVNIGSASGFTGRSCAPAGARAGIFNLTRAMAAQPLRHRLRQCDRAEQDRLARGRGRVRSARPVRTWQAPGRSEGSGKGRALSRERRFFLRLRRQPVRGRRSLGDGFVVIPHQRPPRFTSRRITSSRMAPTVAEMIAAMIPAPM